MEFKSKHPIVIRRMDWEDEPMTKEARKRRILKFLVDTGLEVPPKVIHHNIEFVTWSVETTKRLLREMLDEGYVERVDDTNGYYRATDAGEQHLQLDDST